MLKVPVHQVAGHRASDGNLGPLVDDSGRFYKPLQGDERGSNEVAFYTSFSSNTKIPDHIRRFFPVFHGTQLLEASDGSGLCPHLVLQDLVSSCVNPSIMDIKIGASTWPPQASEDYIAKCLKKDREGTSIQLGFRISGFQIYGSKESGFWKADKQFIKSFSTEDVRLVLRKFVSNNASADLDSDPDCAFASVVYGGSSGILAQLLELKAWFEDQTIFHFYSCSVLMMYEKELTVEGRSSGAAVKLVDFAHVVEGGGVIDHNFLACFFTCINLCWALDSDSLQDTCPTATATAAQQPIFINGFPCKNPATVTASDFKSSKLNQSGNKENFARSFTVIVTALDFPGLNTLGLGAARTDLEVDGLVLPHSHPRASEMFYVSKGFVIAGFIDTQNQLFQKFLRQGDVFVFPRGLLHYCVNAGFEPATAFSVLNSQNPGVVSIAGAMFDSEAINILAKKLISLSASGMERVDNVTLFGF